MKLIKKLEDIKNRILVVGPHPDDIEFSTGRLILRRKGRNIYTICISDGRKGQEGTAVKKVISEEDYSKLREKESYRALKEFNIDFNNIFFMGLPDQDIVSNPYIIDKLFMLFRKIKPDYILIPPWEGAHPDHDAVHLFCVMAAKNYNINFSRIIEYGSYNNYNGEFSVQEFIPKDTVQQKFIPTKNEQKKWFSIMKLFKSQLNQQKDYIPKSTFENFRVLPKYDYKKLPYSTKSSKIIRGLLSHQIARKIMSKKDKLFYETWNTNINPIIVKNKLNGYVEHYLSK